MDSKNENPKWILIVDDEPEIRLALKDLVSRSFENKVKVIEAENGIEATRKINYQAFDCIITDLQMPKKDGYAFIKTVRQNSFNESTPIIVLSGFIENEKDLSDEKFVYFFSKPFEVDGILEIIDRQIKLGSNENRISSDSLNELIQQTSSFIQTLTENEKTENLDIKLKKAGESLPYRDFATLEMNKGKICNIFSLMVENKIEAESKQNSKPFQEQSDLDLIQTLCKKILLASQSQKPQSKREEATIRQMRHTPLSAQDKPGIIVTVGNQDLKISIFVANHRRLKSPA